MFYALRFMHFVSYTVLLAASKGLALPLKVAYNKTILPILSSPYAVHSQVAAAWWTRRTSPVPLTIVTHSDTTRLDQLEAQCVSWAGPLDAVLYVSLVRL
jgi:hypothetical protein